MILAKDQCMTEDSQIVCISQIYWLIIHPLAADLTYPEALVRNRKYLPEA